MGCSASRHNTTFLSTKNSPSHPQQDQEEEEQEVEEQCSSSPYVSSSSPLDNSMFSSSHYSSSTTPTPPRAFSLHTPLIHHPPSRKGDSHHLVSLTSSTYGSLLLLHPRSPPHTSSSSPAAAADHPGDSLSPDSVINTWELMDGLDDDLDFENSNKAPTFPAKEGSFRDLGSGYFDSEEIVAEAKPVSSSKPLWKHLSEEAFLSKMDPDVVSSYMRALSSRQLGCNRKEPSFTRSVDSSPAATTTTTPIGLASNVKEDNKIVVYFTSLRGIRKTYEDCCAVRMILRGFRVLVDERDISMDSAYRKELQGLLKGKAMSLPQVFIRGKHIGGVDEIRQLNEAGELGKLLGGIPVRDHPGLVCESCGDARFVPCPNCSGSRKVFDVDEEQLRRCPDCNENGLIRCPGCCSS